MLVPTDMRVANVGGDQLPVMKVASTETKARAHTTAVLGVAGVKRELTDLLTILTGQPPKYFTMSMPLNSDWRKYRVEVQNSGFLKNTEFYFIIPPLSFSWRRLA